MPLIRASTKLLWNILFSKIKYRHCVKSVQIRSYFWPVFSCIRIECGPEITPYLDTFHAVRETEKHKNVDLFTIKNGLFLALFLELPHGTLTRNSISRNVYKHGKSCNKNSPSLHMYHGDFSVQLSHSCSVRTWYVEVLLYCHFVIPGFSLFFECICCFSIQQSTSNIKYTTFLHKLIVV